MKPLIMSFLKTGYMVYQLQLNVLFPFLRIVQDLHDNMGIGAVIRNRP